MIDESKEIEPSGEVLQGVCSNADSTGRYINRTLSHDMKEERDEHSGAEEVSQ
jgi:hypothetical protein